MIALPHPGLALLAEPLEVGSDYVLQPSSPRATAARPFGGDDEANSAVIAAMADAWAFAERRKRFITTKFRNMDAEARERAHVEGLSAEIDSRASRALVDPKAFRDAVQVLIWQRHGRQFSIAPLPKYDGATVAADHDLDAQIMDAEVVRSKTEQVLNNLRRKLEKATTDHRKAVARAADLHETRDRRRAAGARAGA